MKISDIISDWIINTELFEMAYQRKKAIDIITNYQGQIATHLVKHLYYDVSIETKKHWEAEINAWLGTINRIKLKGNKRLNPEVYYKILFEEPLGELSDIQGIVDSIDRFDDGMSSYGKVGDIRAVHEPCEKILHAISYDASHDKLQRIDYYLEKFA